MKPVFKLSNYTSDIYVMYCDTEEKANDFLKFLDKNGMKWRSGKSYTGHNKFNSRTQICYCFNDGSYASLNWAIFNGYIILEYDDFYWDNEKLCKFMNKVTK